MNLHRRGFFTTILGTVAGGAAAQVLPAQVKLAAENRPLTTVSLGYVQQQADFVAGNVFPQVPSVEKSNCRCSVFALTDTANMRLNKHRA